MEAVKNNLIWVILLAGAIIVTTCAFLIAVDCQSLKYNKCAVDNHENTIKHLLIIEEHDQTIQAQLNEIKQIIPRKGR